MFYACCEGERTQARDLGPDSRDGRPQGCNPIGPTTIEGPKIGTIRKLCQPEVGVFRIPAIERPSMERKGIEPSTSALRTRRSPN